LKAEPRVFTDGIETTRTLKADGVASMPNGQLSLTSIKSAGSFSPNGFIDTRIDGSTFQLPVDPCASTARPASE